MKCSVCGRTIWRFWCWMVVQNEHGELKTNVWCSECHTEFREGFPDDELIVDDEAVKIKGNDHPDKSKGKFLEEVDTVIG